MDMDEYKGPKCPKCDGGAIVSVIDRDDLKMTFICCWSCGAVIAYRDNLLMDKLDEVIKALTDIH